MFAGIEHLGLFVVTGLLLNLTPGPDVLYIVANGLREGWRAGVVAALGITAGCFVHIAAAAIGLSALVAASATAFTLLKWVGAAYLLYVGLAMLLRRKSAAGQPVLRDGPVVGGRGISLRRVFVQGFWTNVLNPKVALFFLALLPQFIDADAPNKTGAFVFLGAWFVVQGFAFLALFVWLVAPLRRWQPRPAVTRGLHLAGAGLFALLAARLALTERA